MGWFRDLVEQINQRRTVRRWARLAVSAQKETLPQLQHTVTQAWALRRQLDKIIHQAEYRLAVPALDTNQINRPMGTDWALRPPLWRGPIAKKNLTSAPNGTIICEKTTLYHDCRHPELTARQIRNTHETDIAPFGFRLDVFHFDGSFLSLALDLPAEASTGLTQKHIIRMDMIADMEKPLKIFARLNVKHGPNVESMVQEIPLSGQDLMAEFDLGFSKINEKRIEKAWVDIIFDQPAMNQITLRDVTLTRRRRAEL